MLRLVLFLLLALRLAEARAAPLGPPPAHPAPAPDTTLLRLRRQLAAHPRPDTLRLLALTRLAGAQLDRDVRSARPALVGAVALARRLHRQYLRHRDLLAETQLALADYHIALAQYDSAATLLQAATREFNRVGDPGGEMRCLGRLARIADQQGQYNASLRYNFQALNLPLISNTRRFHTSIKIQLGTTYAKVGEYAEAQAYLLDAQCIAEHYNYPDRLNLTLGALGEVSSQQHQWAAARVYFTRSIILSQRIADLPTQLAMQLNLARLAEAQGQVMPATAQARQVLAATQAAHLTLQIPLAQALLARLALHTGQPTQAIAYATSSLQASQHLHLPSGVREASAVLAEAYTQRHDYRPALLALRQYNAANDSLAGETVRRRSALLQFGQQQREQQAQIRLLTQQNRLQAQAQELARLRTQRQLIGLSALTLLLLLVAGTALWQYRRLQAAREARLRTQIAADLHDDVGTLLSQISLQSSFLQEGIDAASQRQQLSQISEASRSAVRQLNDVVWSLDAHNDGLPALLDRLHDYAYEVLSPAGIGVALNIPATLPTQALPITLRRHLYLIYKEALHNVLKHARGATQVTISLTPATNPSSLLLEVRDNAPPAPALVPVGPATLPGRRSGHGLRNIAERAATLGGTATCTPLPEGGFQVLVRIPY